MSITDSLLGKGALLASPRDAAEFRLLPHFGGIEAMDAAFVHHSFAPHTHDELMIGILRSGQKRFRRGRGTFVVGPGALSVVNPGDVHTGERADGALLAYTAIYVPSHVLERAGSSTSAYVGRAVVEDRNLWHGLLVATIADGDRLAGEEALLAGLCALLRCHGQQAGADEGSASKVCRLAVRRVEDYVQANVGDALNLDQLAEVAGIGQRHLLRSFHVASGMTPHAYVTQARIERAKACLKRGEAITEVALATGFADQAHFTRTFKRLTGATPMRYAASLGYAKRQGTESPV